jgi:hypothetical protein
MLPANRVRHNYCINILHNYKFNLLSVLSIMYITMLCQEDIHVLKESFSLQYFRMELLYAEKVNKISLVPSIIPKQYIFSNYVVILYICRVWP